jgi:hypothetical protein
MNGDIEHNLKTVYLEHGGPESWFRPEDVERFVNRVNRIAA